MKSILVSDDAVVAVIGISKFKLVSLLRPKAAVFLFIALGPAVILTPIRFVLEAGDRLFESP